MTTEQALELITSVVNQVSLPFQSPNPQQATHEMVQNALKIIAEAMERQTRP